MRINKLFLALNATYGNINAHIKLALRESGSEEAAFSLQRLLPARTQLPK